MLRIFTFLEALQGCSWRICGHQSSGWEPGFWGFLQEPPGTLQHFQEQKIVIFFTIKNYFGKSMNILHLFTKLFNGEKQFFKSK